MGNRLESGVHTVKVVDMWRENYSGGKRLVFAFADDKDERAFQDCYMSSPKATRWTNSILATLGWDGRTPISRVITSKALIGRPCQIRVIETEWEGNTRLQVSNVWPVGQPEPASKNNRIVESDGGEDEMDAALRTGEALVAKPEPEGWDSNEDILGDIGNGK